MYCYEMSQSLVPRYEENHGEWDSIVCIATSYGLDSPGIEFW
jgi:hypothetical protein